MSQLPLFPLNTVLFPQTPIQLHIFEDRYVRMIGNCLRDGAPFGVVLIRSGAEALGPLAEPYEVGVSAEIISSEKLPGGRFNLLAVGGERFRIRSLDPHTHAYLTGEVEPYPWRMPAPQALAERAAALRTRLLRYLARLRRLDPASRPPGENPTPELTAQKLPEPPFELACLAAAVLEIQPTAKQRLLECEGVDDLIDELIGLYRRETALIQAILDHGPGGEQGFLNN